MTEGSDVRCPSCGSDVEPNSDFCPRCGSLLIDGVACELHPSNNAVGVCVICATPFCRQCRSAAAIPYLCDRHASYEIYEGMARIYGTFDNVYAEFLRSCLEQAGFHPFVYSMKASPLYLGGPEYTGFMSSGDTPQVIVNEFKLLVPCHEVVKAEGLLRELEASGESPQVPP